jgi:lipopolysaccharide export system protein LptC
VFRAARRHSRRVRLLRIALPLGVVGVVTAFALAAWLNPLRVLAKLPVGNLVVSGTRITMEQPRLTGYTRDARGYQLSARAAAQDLTAPDKVELDGVHARVELENDGLLEITAANGIFDNKAQVLTLRQNIVLKSNGNQGLLSEAVVDIRKGTVVSSKPVQVQMLNGHLTANRLEVSEQGGVLLFDGGVTLQLSAAEAQRSDAQAGIP